MDRVLSDEVKRGDRIRRAAKVLLPVAGVAVVLALLPGWMRPSISRARIRTAVVETGPLAAVIEASGVVMPEIERVLSSPVDARLVRVLRRAGDPVSEGDPVAELDLAESALALDRIVTNAGISSNQQSQARLGLQRSLADLAGRIERKSLELQMLTEKAESAERLFAEGLVSRQGMRDARLAARQADIELTQLRREEDHAEESANLQLQGLALQRGALDKEASQARRLLELATTRSDRSGVVTWVLSQEGSLVRRGEVIARIADLSSFRVDGSVSDLHAARIRVGAQVVVKVNEGVSVDGSISQVAPSVEGGVVRFQVAMRERSHALLRPNLRVDVLVITDRKAHALKVRQGPFDEAGGTARTFVIRGDWARRTTVQFGVRGPEEVEVTSGLVEGDEVVISDMRDYLHLEELEVQ